MTKSPTKPPKSGPKKATGPSAKAPVKPAQPTNKPPLSASAKSAAVIGAPKRDSAFQPTIVKTSEPVVAAPLMRKKELIETVVARSGVKKRDAKPVIEAMLSVLGTAIADERELNLEPMGKLKINRTKTGKGAKVIVCKLRHKLAQDGPVPAAASSKPAKPAPHSPAVKDPLADKDD